jgi:hypothetical protein
LSKKSPYGNYHPSRSRARYRFAGIPENPASGKNQVILHVHLKILDPPIKIRIWPNTLLIPYGGGAKARMIQSIGISKAPQWMFVTRKSHVFTLIFEGLTKDCQVFDLVEDIPSVNRFQYLGISRNQSDVYHLSMPG